MSERGRIVPKFEDLMEAENPPEEMAQPLSTKEVVVPSKEVLLPTEKTPSAIKFGETEFDEETLKEAIIVGLNKERVSLYSPIVSMMHEYMDRTTPQFNRSEFGAKNLETFYKRKFPDLWNAIEAAMNDPDIQKHNKKRRTATPLRKKKLGRK